MNAKAFFLVFFALPGLCAAANEAYYVQLHCQGEIEVTLHDRTRVDCLTDTHAIEYDWGPKWHEAIGQSLGYAFETNKRAGIVLILKNQGQYKHWLKLNSIIDHYQLPIDTWKIDLAKEQHSGD